MMIQRWQTVWLLIATILMVVFCFVPMALVNLPAAEGEFENSATLLMPADAPVLLTINILVALLLFLAIFLYKNSKLQKRLTILSMLLIIVAMVTEALLIFTWDTTAGRIEWLGSIFLLIGSLLFALLAFRGIRHDENLLRAADRLR